MGGIDFDVNYSHILVPYNVEPLLSQIYTSFQYSGRLGLVEAPSLLGKKVQAKLCLGQALCCAPIWFASLDPCLNVLSDIGLHCGGWLTAPSELMRCGVWWSRTFTQACSLVSRVVAVPFACLSGLSCPVFSVGRFVSGRSFACVSRVGRAVLFGREY